MCTINGIEIICINRDLNNAIYGKYYRNLTNKIRNCNRWKEQANDIELLVFEEVGVGVGVGVVGGVGVGVAVVVDLDWLGVGVGA
jgi:hypothetical protein